MTVTIIVTEDIASLRRTDGTYRYAFEINCYGKHDAAHPEKFVWQQFMFDVDTDASGQNAQLSWWVNGYRQQDLPNNALLGSNRTRLTGLSSSHLPQGWQLTMALTTDQSSNNVTGVTFGVTQPNGSPVSSGLQNLTNLSPGVTSANLAPILNVQAILVGEFNKQYTDFSSGQGIFLFYETNNLIASASQDESAEGGNVSYSALPASYPNGEFYQFFGVPSA